MHHPTLLTRTFDSEGLAQLTRAGLPPVLARVLAARGVHSAAELDAPLGALLPPASMKNLDHAAQVLADAIAQQKRLLIVGDYDADGATASALGVRGLRSLGARIDYLVPNRFDYGYGLSPEIVQVAAQRQPDLIITVDNGIASVEGVETATSLGIATLVTDHHLPGDILPNALCIVNPNQSGCPFASKHLAGVGVMFYVVMATRAELRRRGAFAHTREPNLASLLDLVALGTVADVVKLDSNNRLLVRQGLQRIRTGQACAGIQALLQVAGRDARLATTEDLGFLLGPRLNAAGRLQDISLGIECLLTDAPERALDIARQLDQLNRDRRAIEAEMQVEALARLTDFAPADNFSITLFDPAWHQGVVGLVASRIKDRFHRPVVAFALGTDGEVKGSGRSIPGLHLRDAFDLVAKRNPRLLLRFGGHAAAAGVALRADRVDEFAAAFEQVAREYLSPTDLQRDLETDGSIPETDINFALARLLNAQVWGQGFAAPAFRDRFRVAEQKIVGEKHSRLQLQRLSGGKRYNAMLFGHTDALPAQIEAVYRLAINAYNGSYALELGLDYWRVAE